MRKTWKGMNQTKMEWGTERHLPKTDDCSDVQSTQATQALHGQCLMRSQEKNY